MKSNFLLSICGCAASSAGVFFATLEQQGQPGSSPGGTPSQQPSPSNPTPRPNTPGNNNPNQNQPGNNQPGQNQPGQNQPGQNQPGQNQPGQNQPGQNQPGNNQPGQNQPGQNRPGDPDQTPLERPSDITPLNRGNNPRFFSFADQNLEGQFRESAGRLASLERAMTERNQRLVQQLGDVRRLPADRQNAAVLDLLQDILQENAQLQQYLAQSRTLFTGDLNDATTSRPGTNQPRTNRPASNQPGSNQPGNNQPSNNQPITTAPDQNRPPR